MLVYLTSPWVPAEWVKAHGLEPRGVWFEPEFDLERTALSAGVCAFSESVARFAELHPQAAMVFSTHCDQLRRGYDGLESVRPERRFLFNLPATWQTPVARRLFDSELERLGRFLRGLGGREPVIGELETLLVQSWCQRSRLLSAAPALSARQFAEAAARFHWDGQIRLPGAGADEGGERPGARAVPIALVGGPLPRAQWRLLDALEGAGSRVVLNATEVGERSLGSPPQAGGDEPARLPESGPGLGQICLERMVDVFQRPNTQLYAWLGERIRARQARGIVLWAYIGCDLWRAEAQSLREAFGLPVLVLDADEVANGWTRLTGRIEAFVESLQPDAP